MFKRIVLISGVLGVFILLLAAALPGATPWTILAWSDFGMNPVERDYSVFAIWPPYGTIRAQVMDASGKLVKSGSAVRVTYEALADSAGSVNSTSSGKTNFWAFSKALFGAGGAPDTGITGATMPSGGPVPMVFDGTLNRFSAEGVPITPYDDQWNLNYYPLMKVTARDATGTVLATARVSLPVSNEVECRGCHASGANAAAAPLAGYANDPNPNRDFKLNILAVHDQLNRRNPAYISTLATAGFPAEGLLAAVNAGKPVLCTTCHASNEFSKAGLDGALPLTTAMHSYHAGMTDPKTNDLLDNSTDRAACYSCHPGNGTHALRGAMGHSVDSGGKLQVQCQSCHGKLSVVGDPARRGYLDMPNCQACHSSQLPRQTSALNTDGTLRVSADTTFATTSNQPVAGVSLYRYSTGHGGLQCAACHGATHAEYPSAQPNDNLQSTDAQGAPGAIKECSACHRTAISNSTAATGGPHGMHNTGTAWVSQHENVASRNRAACQSCHGNNYEGTALSQAFVTRNLATEAGTMNAWPGFRVSCYSCHNGPGGSGRGPASASVTNTSRTATSGQALTIPINLSGGTLRIVTQPRGGTASVTGNSIVYQPDAGFEGADQITYASSLNNRDSNLGTAALTVTSATRPGLPAAPVANAASYAPGAVAPGMITFIGGQGLGPANLATFELNSGGFIEKSLQSTRVLFDGKAAPVIYASGGAVSAIAPYALAGQSQTQLVVEYGGIPSAPVTVPVRSAVPGLFTLDGSGRGQAAAVNQDGTLNTTANPAPKGSVILLYLTGDGTETPVPPDGRLAIAPYPQASQNVIVTIGGRPAVVVYAGAAPGAVAGLMQVNATVPADAASGPNEVIFSSGAAPSPAAVTIQVK